MKTLRISDYATQKMAAMIDEITAQSIKTQTYTDNIENMLSTNICLPVELLNEIQSFVEANPKLGYTSREEFISDAIHTQLRISKDQYTCVEIPKEEYDESQQALQDLGTEFLNVEDFINKQLHTLLEKYQEWSSQKEEYE